MEGISDLVLLCLVMSGFSVLLAIYLYSRHAFSYFQRRGIYFEKPAFPFGNLWSVILLKRSYNEFIGQMYIKHRGKRFVGWFQFLQKSVLVIDRELIKNVLVKDFDYFNEKNIHYNKNVEPLSAHLFSIHGEEWQNLRVKMNPVFSSGKVKMMFKTVADIAIQLNDFLKKLSRDSDVIECKDVFMRYGIAIISSTAFGIESDVFENKSSSFFRVCESIMSPSLSAIFRNSLMFFGKDIAKALRVRVIPRDTHDFVMNLVKDVVKYREEHKKTRNDFLQIMMKLRGVQVGDVEHQITIEELAAQAYIFILGGFEPVSNNMSFFLYEMAMNPHVQQRVMDEVDKFDDVTYDTLAEMEYLEMAINETMRKHSSLGFMSRVCSKDYLVPGTDDVIEKGTHVLISMHGLHWDSDLFPNPELFIPERFSRENKDNIKPFSFLPFGDGPRICIGMRFGKLAVKTGLAMMLKKFRVERTSKTPDPLEYEPRTITTTAKGGIYLRLVPRAILNCKI